MDDATRRTYRVKFYKLAGMLNVIIFLVVLAAVLPFSAFSWTPPWLPAVLFIIAAGMIVHFRRRYRETRAWLYEQMQKDDDGED
ncbi:MAG: hypothetical protein ACXQTG_06715 [Methanoculleaceae archaeon]